MTIFNKTIPFIVSLLLIATLSAAANTGGAGVLPGDDLSVSAFMGKTFPRGFYENYLLDGNSLGMGLIYPLPLSRRFFLAETEFLASEHALRGSRSSELSIYTLRAGALIYYPWTRYFQPYGGLSLQESYLILKAGTIGERETTLKPGLAAKAGFFSAVYREFGIRAGMEYAVMDLSGERLETYSFIAAAVLRVPLSRMLSPEGKYGADPVEETLQGRAGTAYRRGLAEIDKGNLEAAEARFREALELAPGHPEASKKISEIGTAREFYAEAKTLAGQKKLYEAIPLFEKSRGYVKEADGDIALARAGLSGEIPGLERKGIAAYENRKYDQCIAIMKMILTVDPENQTGKLYLPRAQSRKQTIERLK